MQPFDMVITWRTKSSAISNYSQDWTTVHLLEFPQQTCTAPFLYVEVPGQCLHLSQARVMYLPQNIHGLQLPAVHICAVPGQEAMSTTPFLTVQVLLTCADHFRRLYHDADCPCNPSSGHSRLGPSAIFAIDSSMGQRDRERDSLRPFSQPGL